MLHPSTKKLIDKLGEMTFQHKIDWIAGEDDVVIYDTEGYRVTLSGSPTEMLLSDALGKELDHANHDELVGTATDEGTTYADFIGTLHVEAQRVAKGTESAIDSVLAGFDSDGDGAPDEIDLDANADLATEGNADETISAADIEDSDDLDDETETSAAHQIEDDDVEGEDVAGAVASMAEEINGHSDEAEADTATDEIEVAPETIEAGIEDVVAEETEPESFNEDIETEEDSFGMPELAAGLTAAGGLAATALTSASGDVEDTVVEPAETMPDSLGDVSEPAEIITEIASETKGSLDETADEILGEVADVAEDTAEAAGETTADLLESTDNIAAAPADIQTDLDEPDESVAEDMETSSDLENAEAGLAAEADAEFTDISAEDSEHDTVKAVADTADLSDDHTDDLSGDLTNTTEEGEEVAAEDDTMTAATDTAVPPTMAFVPETADTEAETFEPPTEETSSAFSDSIADEISSSVDEVADTLTETAEEVPTSDDEIRARADNAEVDGMGGIANDTLDIETVSIDAPQATPLSETAPETTSPQPSFSLSGLAASAAATTASEPSDSANDDVPETANDAESISDVITDAVETAAEDIGESVDDSVSGGDEAVESKNIGLIDDLSDFNIDGVESVTDAAKTVTGAAAGSLGSAYGTAKSAFNDAGEALEDTADTATEAAETMVEDEPVPEPQPEKKRSRFNPWM